MDADHEISIYEDGLVSIITPAFNSEDFIAHTINSVQSQTYQVWEMFIVDDCSSDRTKEIVHQAAAQDTRIELLTLTKNVGPAVARNIALKHASGRFVAFLDSDDLWLPDKLEQQVNFMLRTNIAFSYTQYRRLAMLDQNSGRLIDVPTSLTYWQLLRNTAIATSTVIIDRQKTGSIQTLDRGYDDFILWLSILKKGFVAYGLQEDLGRYRCGSSTSVSSNKLRSIKWVWSIYSDVERLNTLLAAWCFFGYAWNAYWKRRRF
ncbi:MAG: glycosyltransferase family 2 protein [Leptolyngbyaceae cyanobacterium]